MQDLHFIRPETKYNSLGFISIGPEIYMKFQHRVHTLGDGTRIFIPFFGITIAHPHTRLDQQCSTFVTLNVPNAELVEDKKNLWNLQCMAPLTIGPSVICEDCGFHGVLKRGEWFPLQPADSRFPLTERSN